MANRTTASLKSKLYMEHTLPAAHSAPLLKIDRATIIKGTKHLLDDLSLEIAEGEHTAILGPNGSGKSSFIRLLTRQFYPISHDTGKPVVTIFGQDRWDIFQLRALMGIVSADLHHTFTSDSGLTGMEVVLSGFFASQGLARNHHVTPEMRARAWDALDHIAATYLADKLMEQMSTGEARRVLIARALVSDPRALLLDEPTTGLDIVASRRFMETLRGIAQRGKTVLLVTHHLEEIIPEIERIILIKDGRVFRDGPKAEVLTAENLTALFETPMGIRASAGYFHAEVQI